MVNALMTRFSVALCQRHRVQEPSLAGRLLCHFIKCGFDSRQHELQSVLDIVEDVRVLIGTAAGDAEPSSETAFSVVNELTVHSIISQIFSIVADVESTVEWVLAQLKAITVAPSGTPFSSDDVDDEREEIQLPENFMESTRAKLEASCSVQMTSLQVILDALALTAYTGSTAEQLIPLLVSGLKLVTTAALTIQRSKRLPSLRFQELIHQIAKSFEPHVYSMLTFLQDSDSGAAVSKSSSKARIRREARQIPLLVEACERFDLAIIKLSNSSKIDMARWLRRSTARDFRLKITEDMLIDAPAKPKAPTANLTP